VGEEFDIIVIGGGSAGSAAAGRLSEDAALSVCLIEAGGANDGWKIRTPGMLPLLPKASNWRYETVPQPGLNGRRGYQPRGRGLGGSSAINAMVYIRGARWDYDQWAADGCTGWGWDEVLPWFKRAEANKRGADAWHGGDGPLHVSDQHWPNPGSTAFIEAARALQLPINHDFNGARQDGFGLFQVTQHKGERWSAARAYLDPARGRENLSIRTGALVERIVIEDGRAAGVIVRRGSNVEALRARGGVVLSAGAFGSPQILMLSGIGSGAQLREHGIETTRDVAGVGGNLHDHIDYVASFETGHPDFFGKSVGGLVKTLRSLWEHRRHRTGAMTTCYAEAGGFWSHDRRVPAPEIQFHFVPAMLEDHGRTSVKGHGYSLHACVLRPESRGTVRLASADAAAPPLIDPAFLSDNRDITLLRDGVRMAYRLCESPPLARYAGVDRHPVAIDDDDALDRIIRDCADTIYHPVGTCRMGSDADAVIDPRLRLNGIERLYVADASVMPRIVSGNTNAPSIMIGERCADFVKADLRS